MAVGFILRSSARITPHSQSKVRGAGGIRSVRVAQYHTPIKLLQQPGENEGCGVASGAVRLEDEAVSARQTINDWLHELLQNQ